MEQHTWEIITTEGVDYLVLGEGDDIKEVFELYKNDEAGEYLKETNAELLAYKKID